MPGIANTCSTATAPPVRPTSTSPICPSIDGSARRSTARVVRAGGRPAIAHVATQRSADADRIASARRRPMSPPAGIPRASAGSAAFAGPSHPDGGAQRSQTATTTRSEVASRNSGSAVSMAARAPDPRARRPRVASRRAGAQRRAATTTASAIANAISVRETPSASRVPGRTGRPEIHDVPRSPRRTPASQSSETASGPRSRPSCARTAASASGVASRSA